jgi:hypothetical protein
MRCMDSGWESPVRAMPARTCRDERLGNWLALLALLAGSIVFAPADGATPCPEHSATLRSRVVTAEAITLR